MVQQRNVRVGPVDHIGVVVADSKAAEFGSRLGLRVDANEVVEAVRVRLVYLVAPGPSHQCAVQLVEPVRDGPIATFLEDHGEGPHHVRFTTRTFGEPLDTLGDRGYRLPGREGAGSVLSYRPFERHISGAGRATRACQR